MSDTPAPEDPLLQMRQAYDQALEGWSATMERMVSSEQFAAASGQMLSRYVEMQEAMRTASRAGAQSLNLPTLDDLAKVARLVINVERKLDEMADDAHATAGRLARIEARLDALAERATAPAPPRRSRAAAPKAPKAPKT